MSSHINACKFCNFQTGVFWISEIKLTFGNPPESTDNHVAVVGGEFLHTSIFMFFTYLSLLIAQCAAAFCDFSPPGSHLAVSQEQFV